MFDQRISSPGLSLQSYFATLASCASSVFDHTEAFVRQYLHNAGSLLITVQSEVEQSDSEAPRVCALTVDAVPARRMDGTAVFPCAFSVRVTERDDAATDHAFTFRGRKESITHHIRNRSKRSTQKPGTVEPSKVSDMSEEAKLATKKLDRI